MSMQTVFNRLGNPVVAALLHSPLHAMLDGSTMLISVRGRRTGELYTTPVNYLREGNLLTVVTFRGRTWWRNLRGGADVAVHLQGQERRGRASVAEDDTAVADALRHILALNPAYARFLRVRMRPDGTAEPGDVARAARSRVALRIDLA